MDGQTTRRRPTLKTLAQETGLAVTTVSKALNDAPDIGARTKEKVREAARRLGYRPNRAGIRLRTGRTQVLSFLLTPELDMMSHTAQLIHALSSELRGTGYHLIVTPVFDDEDPLEQLRYIVETGSADAVFLNKIRPVDPRIAFLHENNLPVITHGRSAMGIEHPWYDHDNARIVELALEALARRKRRRILIVAPPMTQNYALHIREGALATADRLGQTVEFLIGATSDSPADKLEAALVRELAAGRYDGVFASSIRSTINVVAALESLGQALGRDVDVAGKEPIPFLQRFRKELISVRENSADAGTYLARAALRRLEHPDDPPMQHLEVPTEADLYETPA